MSEDVSVDVVIVGAGACGLVAALAAVENGATVSFSRSSKMSAEIPG
jgi:succinate dehydrogenase/fumarate reductase flavoprotein subunit